MAAISYLCGQIYHNFLNILKIIFKKYYFFKKNPRGAGAGGGGGGGGGGGMSMHIITFGSSYQFKVPTRLVRIMRT